MSHSLLRRVGVYGHCIRDGAILLTRLSPRDPEVGRWTLPGGGMAFGETPHATLLREFREETGLKPRILGLVAARSQVHPPDERRAGPLQAVQFVYRVDVSGEPVVTEEGGSTEEAAWVRLTEARALPLVALAAWAVEA